MVIIIQDKDNRMTQENLTAGSRSNNSTDVLRKQGWKIDPHHKIDVTFFIKNHFGEIIEERRCRLSPSYYKRGLKRWFLNYGIKEFKVRLEPRQNHVVAIGIIQTLKPRGMF